MNQGIMTVKPGFIASCGHEIYRIVMEVACDSVIFAHQYPSQNLIRYQEQIGYKVDEMMEIFPNNIQLCSYNFFEKENFVLQNSRDD